MKNQKEFRKTKKFIGAYLLFTLLFSGGSSYHHDLFTHLLTTIAHFTLICGAIGLFNVIIVKEFKAFLEEDKKREALCSNATNSNVYEFKQQNYRKVG